MLCKRMNTLHNKAGELLEEIRAGQRERNERMLAVFGEVLKAARAVDMDGQSAARPWSPVRQRYETGKVVLEMIDAHGGLAGLLAEHEALAAHHGGSHLPLLERCYRSSRGLLLRLLNVLEFEATSTDHRLLHAVEWVKANQNRTSRSHQRGPHHRPRHRDPGPGAARHDVRARGVQKVIRDKRNPGKLTRRHFELCVLSCLADELVRGDVAAAGSDLYANWQRQLLSFADCQPYLPGYCRRGWPARGRGGLRRRAQGGDEGPGDPGGCGLPGQRRSGDRGRRAALAEGTQRRGADRVGTSAGGQGEGTASRAVAAGGAGPRHTLGGLAPPPGPAVGIRPQARRPARALHAGRPHLRLQPGPAPGGRPTIRAGECARARLRLSAGA